MGDFINIQPKHLNSDIHTPIMDMQNIGRITEVGKLPSLLAAQSPKHLKPILSGVDQSAATDDASVGWVTLPFVGPTSRQDSKLLTVLKKILLNQLINFADDTNINLPKIAGTDGKGCAKISSYKKIASHVLGLFKPIKAWHTISHLHDKPILSGDVLKTGNNFACSMELITYLHLLTSRFSPNSMHKGWEIMYNRQTPCKAVGFEVRLSPAN
ncbi:hypothetical protein C8J57DRAFT_1220933 [Mycena rebaudengoi]|nr:hypothetical protein C8J57DRAFT_1220933 [Mycena rebaudengoi]